MTNSDDMNCVAWQIFELGGPGPHFPRWAVARTLRDALTIALEDEPHLDAGLALVVWNRTRELMRVNHPMQLHTARLLNEQRAGLVFFDRRDGWERLEAPGDG